jgi:hypothetical protein
MIISRRFVGNDAAALDAVRKYADAYKKYLIDEQENRQRRGAAVRDFARATTDKGESK